MRWSRCIGSNMKKVVLGLEARKLLKKGVDTCANVVRVSMGGNGKNVAIYTGYNTDVINDGVSIAREVKVKEEELMAGVQLAKQCAETTNRDCGDGTTTTIVLLQEVLNQVITDLETVKPRVLRETLFTEAEKVLGALKVTQVTTKEEIYNLALTASLDKDVASLLSDVFWKLGKDAKVSIQETDKVALESEIVEGLQFETTYQGIIGLKNDEKIVVDNCPVLYLEKAETLEKIQEKLNEGHNSLVVVSNAFERSVVLALSNPNVKIYAVRNNEINAKDDIAPFVGDGKCNQVIIEKDKTTIIGGTGDVETHVTSLKTKASEASQYDREVLEKRIASLTSGVAVIKIGKATAVETNESVLKIEDAVNATKSAMQEGYVRGGGIALKEASEATDNLMLKAICQSPYNQMQKNGTDEIPETAIDSAKTVKKSLLNALSTGCSILTTEACLIELKDENDD